MILRNPMENLKQILSKDEDALSPVILPFRDIQINFQNKIIAAFWMNQIVDQNSYKQDFDQRYGAGNEDAFTLTHLWLSNPENIVVIGEKADISSQIFFQANDFQLGSIVRSSYKELPKVCQQFNLPLFNIDGHNSYSNLAYEKEMQSFINNKENLKKISSYSAPYILHNLEEQYLGPFPIIIKECNQESFGDGVHKADNKTEYNEIIKQVKNKAETYQLKQYIILQPLLKGKECGLNFIQTPSSGPIVTAVTFNIADQEGRYIRSINLPNSHPIYQETLPVIQDMSDKIRSINPNTFGYMMNDFFITNHGPQTIDPGMRTTGNTATAMARIWAEEQTSKELYSTINFVISKQGACNFASIFNSSKDLFSLESIQKNGFMLAPWGWNNIQGNGNLIILSEENLPELDINQITGRI